MTRPSGASLRLARFGFTDATAAATLAGAAPAGLGLWDEHEQKPVDPPGGELLQALGGSADPDLALRQLHRLVATDRDAGAGELLPAVAADPVLLQALAAVLGASTALGDDLVAVAGRWRALRESFDEEEPFGAAPLDTPGELRAAYRGALLRIAADDLTQACDVEQTMVRLSRLADSTLDAARRQAERERGAAPKLAVIAMGKCGGRELNYVSDVDVIFVCESDADIVDSQVVAA